MCPPFARRMVNREGCLVVHCLIVETGEGLVVVDTGFGARDLEDPAARLGRPFMSVVRPRLDPASTILGHLERLGLAAADVRHIVATHLDIDHAGGIADFPHARVHIYRPEHEAATTRPTAAERSRYRPHQFAGARWAIHEADGEGESWNGLRALRPIAGLDLALVPLVGHSRGHCGVALRHQGGWLLHAGDAYFHAAQMDPDRERCPPGLRLFQRAVAADNAARRENLARLRELVREQRGALTVFCAHDPNEFKALSGSSAIRLFA
jgi:glyoxylase-like metal-dependent hydrolase (beta-lactamase superfamily II)